MPVPNIPRSRPRRAIAGGKVVPTVNNPARYADPNYTTNLCPNPSFEISTAGWTATDAGTTISQDNSTALYGAESLHVATSGSIPGQGVIGPPAIFPGQGGIGSMTISITGSAGSLSVLVLTNPGGNVLTNVPVVLSGTGYQTIIINNLPFTSFEQLYVAVVTSYAQAVSFNIDGVMYEPESPAHPYCDGDQLGCQWAGTTGLSTSFQQFQFDFSASVSLHLSGFLNIIALNEVFPLPTPLVLEFTMNEIAGTVGVMSPAAALTDFGIWELTDPDPAMTYGWWTNSGISSGQTGYTQPYAMVVPPLDYPVSNGNYAWRRAAYAAVGFEWASVPNGVQQILTDIQLEYCRTNVGSATTPSTYQRPRQLQVIVKPDRLNYITNPAFYTSTIGWSGIGGGEALAVDSTQFPGNIATYDNLPYGAFQSCKVSLNSASDSGAQITAPFLIPGYFYTLSLYAMPGPQVADILISTEGNSTDIASLILPQYGYGGNNQTTGYSQGPYGGVQASSTPLPQTWTRMDLIFQATSDTAVVQVQAIPVTSPTYPVSFWFTAVLLETGDILLPYFDGNSGVDAIWESGGTPGLSRSYYYVQFEFGQGIVTTALASNTPLGISAATPLYGVIPTQ